MGRKLHRWRGRLALAALPLIALGIGELALRAAGYGGYPPVFREIGRVDGKTLVELDWPGPESYFFRGRFGRGASHQQSFFMPKGTNTIRVFLCGESAIKGDPWPLPLSAGAFLEAMLEDCWPGRDVEVLNLGVTAVASYPVADILRQALPYDPDLVVVYTGNNEFYGSYGVASQHYAGTHPLALRATRALHSLALVQMAMRLLPEDGSGSPATLMDAMMRRQEIAPESNLRAAAARNLEHHVREIVRRCRAQNVPVLVCTLASNERDLAPMGRGAAARAAYARGDFAQALDADTRPWRPTSALQEALLRAADEAGAQLCDVRAAFRAESADGLIGWNLMDDHVHLNLKGQYLLARTIVEAVANVGGSGSDGLAALGPPDGGRMEGGALRGRAIEVDEKVIEALPGFDAYAQRLGANTFTQIGVGVGMMSLFRAPFLVESNPEAYRHWEQQVLALGRALPADVAGAFDDAMRQEALTGGRNPVSGLAGQALARLERYGEAEPLFALACRELPRYTAARREYAYRRFWCRREVRGELDEADFAAIRQEIADGQVLLTYGADPGGKTEFYMGKFYELLGDAASASNHIARAEQKRAAWERGQDRK